MLILVVPDYSLMCGFVSFRIVFLWDVMSCHRNIGCWHFETV